MLRTCEVPVPFFEGPLAVPGHQARRHQHERLGGKAMEDEERLNRLTPRERDVLRGLARAPKAERGRHVSAQIDDRQHNAESRCLRLDENPAGRPSQST
jgi:hypothetical protein